MQDCAVNNSMENNTPTLTLLDLRILRDSIGVAAERGAFKANEMSTIGGAFDRLNSWVTQAEADLAAQQAAAEAEAADESSDTADTDSEQGE